MANITPPALRLYASRQALEPGSGVAPGDALNNIISDGIPDGALVFVLSNRALYEWRAGDTTAGSSPNIIAPADGRPGRWRLLADGSGTGSSYALLPRVIYVDQAAVGSSETGSDHDPYLTMQAAIDGTDAATPTKIYVVGGDYSAESLTIPASRQIDFEALAAPLETVLGDVAINLDVNTSTLRFEGFVIGDTTITEGAAPSSDPTELIYHNCTTGTHNGSTATTSDLKWSFSFEARATGYSVGDITGNGANCDVTASGVATFEDILAIGSALVTGFVSLTNIRMVSRTIEAKQITLEDCDLSASMVFEGFSLGAIRGDEQSLNGRGALSPTLNNIQTIVDTGYVQSPNVVYVNNNQNITPGIEAGSPGVPFMTVQKALDKLDSLLSPGEEGHIIVAPGTYSEDLTATIDYNLVLEGASWTDTFIGTDGGTHTLTISGERNLVFRNFRSPALSVAAITWDINGDTLDRFQVDQCVLDVLDTSGTTACNLLVNGVTGFASFVSTEDIPGIDELIGGADTDLFANDCRIEVITSIDDAFLQNVATAGIASVTGTRLDAINCYGAAGITATWTVTFAAPGGVVNVDNFTNATLTTVTNGSKNVINP